MFIFGRDWGYEWRFSTVESIGFGMQKIQVQLPFLVGNLAFFDPKKTFFPLFYYFCRL